MSVYIDNGYETDCGFSWNSQPEKPDDCKKCFENDWCPLSLHNKNELPKQTEILYDDFVNQRI